MPSKNRNIGVDCGNCSKRLLPAKFVCFFWKAKNEVYISVKNQFKVAAMASLYIEKVGAKDEVRCQFCNASVGVQLPFGPHGSNYISLGKKKVIVGGIQCEPNDKVSQKLIPRLKKQIDEVNMDTFYGRSIVPDFGNWSSLIARQVPVQFASPSAPEHFDWSDLLVSDKVPRTYQLEAFVEALQRDLVLVLPTGSGKTLVAALLLARMRALNPGRMGALLVERVPLVFQQAKALEADTGLKVAALCGEIMTSWKIRELLDGAHDLVVITAGALLSLITNRRIPDLSAFSCIVIDECHHASSPRHNFPRVLKLNHQLPEDMRPRLLGLTASPVEPGDGDSEGQKKLRRLLSFFSPDCVAFRPAKAEESAVQTVTKLCHPSSLQIQFAEDLSKLLTDSNEKLNLGLPIGESMPVPSNRLRMLAGQLRGFIYSGLPQFRNNREEIRDLLCLLAAMEASQLVGVSKAAPFLDDLRCISTATMRFRSDPNWQLDVSERMRVVEAEAASLLQVENKESRLLVLTWTRRTARLLHARLSELFPNLRPQLVVGRGGADGMDWDGEQSVAIDSFNDGSSRLIVSTAVLEEGLDVSECDVVIRFDAAKSLVQLLQSRGRARKKDSRFLMVVDENEAAAATDLSERENMLNRVVDDHSLENGVPSELTRQMVKHLAERKSPVQAARSVVAHYSMGLTGKMGGQIMVQLCCPELQRKDCDKEALMLSIEKENFVKVRSIDLLFDQCENHSLPSGLFPRDSTVAAVYLETHSTLDSPLGIYPEFARRWSFELNNKPIYAMPDVRKVEDSDDDSIKKSERTVQALSSVAIGQFQTKTKVVEALHISEENIELEIDSNRNLISVFFRAAGVSLVVSSIGGTNGFAMVDWSKELIALPLAVAPTILKTVEQEDQQNDWDFNPISSESFCNTEDLSGKIRQKFETNSVLILHLPRAPRSAEPLDWMRLRATFPLPLLDTRLESEEYASPGESETLFEYCHRVKPIQELSVRDKAEFQCRWQMQALIDSRRFLITQESAAGIENRIAAAAQADSKLDNDCPTNLIKLANALLTLSATGDGEAFFEDVLGDRLNSALIVLEVTDEDAEDAAVGPPVACGSVLVKRAAVTPTRVVLFPATPVASSRLLRRIPPERLVMVAFTDESCGVVRGGGVNVASAASVGARFTKVLRDGLTLAGRRYRFFSASSGQLRTSRCFFVAAESVEEVQRLRDQLVENPTEFRSVSKYLSRLGLFHTADTWVAKLETNQVSKCIDHRALNDDLLTDGSGKISSELAMSIKSKLDLPELPFAFQFRFGGAKGVLTTVSDKDPNLGLQQGILLRPSTVKFKSSDTNLCIVGTSQCGRLCLNREIITLLEALASKCDSWNPSQRLRNILDAELRKIAESLATPSAATAALREFIDKPSLATASVVEAARHFNFLTDPHWLGLLRCVFRFRLSDLQKRAALPVGDLGCRVMGAPDPLEVLAEGQVFLRIKRKPSDQAKQIEGPVLIYRNPCLHPGDVRVVQAVAKPQLCGWLNLLLLPSRTDCRRSLAADCSGGDLDGDQFGVVWDPELVPPLEAVHEPLDYAKLASNEPQLPEGADVTNPVLLANFCAQNFANSFLGRVANLHLAICDQLPGGALNQLAIEVAKAQSVAVDFPKTGIVPEVPEAAVKFVKEKGYPDFMERSDSYPSDKLLGQLYRRCRSCDLDWDLLDSIDQENQQYEYDVTWAGQEKFLKSASRLFELYRSDLRALMSQWGARSDRELQLGRCFQWHPLLRTDRGRAHIAMRQGFDALGNKYRRIFDQLAGDDQNKRRAQAAAWFAVAYKSVGTSKAKKPRGLSFPWVVTDVLCEIRSHGMSTSVLQTGSASLQSIDEGLEVSIGRSVFAFFRESLPGLRDAVGRADAAAALVSGRLSQQCAGVLSCKVYGSASILVCDEASSDIDLCVLPLDKAYSEPWLPAEVSVLGECARHRHWLETLVWPSLDAAVLEKTRYLDRQVPLIRCRLGLDGGEDVDDGQECDISMNSVGLGKTRYLLSLYSRCPWRLPLLWLLVQWARAAGIVRSSSESQGLMPTAEFYALVLHCFSEFDEVASNFEESNKCLLDLSLSERLAFLMDRLTDKASDANFAFLGSCILRFVRFCSELSDAVTYKWQRVESASSVQISAEVVRGVAELADVASRVLVYTHSAASIVSSAAIISSLSGKAIRLTQRLPGILSTEMLRSLRFHETRLRLTTGCDSVQLEETTGSRRLLIRAIGAPSAIDRLRHELRELSARFGLSGSWTRKYNNGLRYFLEGGGTVMATRCLSNSCRIELIDHLGSVNVEHQMHDVCVPLCLGTDGIDFTSWTDEAARRLFALMCRQFSRLRSSRSECQVSAMLKDLELSVRVGRVYFLNATNGLPDDRRSISLAELAVALAAGKKFRKGCERPDFRRRDASDATRKHRAEKMVSLAAPGGASQEPHPPLKPERAPKPNRRKKYKLGVGFLAGIVADLHRISTGATVEVYEKALKSLGYVEIPKQTEPALTGWKVSVRLSASYQAHLQHDLSLQLVRVYERPLNCIYMNVLDSDRPGERNSAITASSTADCETGSPSEAIGLENAPSEKSNSHKQKKNRKFKRKRKGDKKDGDEYYLAGAEQSARDATQSLDRRDDFIETQGAAETQTVSSGLTEQRQSTNVMDDSACSNLAGKQGKTQMKSKGVVATAGIMETTCEQRKCPEIDWSILKHRTSRKKIGACIKVKSGTENLTNVSTTDGATSSEVFTEVATGCSTSNEGSSAKTNQRGQRGQERGPKAAGVVEAKIDTESVESLAESKSDAERSGAAVNALRTNDRVFSNEKKSNKNFTLMTPESEFSATSRQSVGGEVVDAAAAMPPSELTKKDGRRQRKAASNNKSSSSVDQRQKCANEAEFCGRPSTVDASGRAAAAGYLEQLDLHINLAACEPVRPSMHRELFPDGEEFPYLVRDPTTGKVVISDRVPKSLTVLVTRQRSVVRQFRRSSSDAEDVWPELRIISGSLHFGGDQNLEAQPVCDLSMHFDPAPLLTAAQYGRYGNLSGYCRRLMQLSLELTSALKEQIRLAAGDG